MTKTEKIREKILLILRWNERKGWQNGMKKEAIINSLEYFIPWRFPNERTIRDILASMKEVASCGKGYYLVETDEDIIKQEEALINRHIIPIAIKIRDMRAAHPELFPSPAQMSIYDSDFWNHVMMREGEIKKRKKGES